MLHHLVNSGLALVFEEHFVIGIYILGDLHRVLAPHPTGATDKLGLVVDVDNRRLGDLGIESEHIADLQIL